MPVMPAAAPPLASLPAVPVLAVPLVPVLVPAAVEAFPLVGAPLMPTGSSVADGEPHADASVSTENAAKEILVTI